MMVYVHISASMRCSFQIEDVRQQTKSEKKRLAMAKRKKQLGALGMTVCSNCWLVCNSVL